MSAHDYKLILSYVNELILLLKPGTQLSGVSQLQGSSARNLTQLVGSPSRRRRGRRQRSPQSPLNWTVGGSLPQIKQRKAATEQKTQAHLSEIARRKALEAEIKQMKAVTEQSTKTHASEIAELNSTLLASQARSVELERGVTQLAELKEEHTATLEKHEQELKKWENWDKRAKAKFEARQEKLKDADERLQVQIAEVSALQDEKTKLVAKLEDKRLASSVHEKGMQDLTEKYGVFEAANAELGAADAELEAELTESMSNREDLAKEHEKIEQQLRESLAKNSAAQEVEADLNQECSRLRKDVTSKEAIHQKEIEAKDTEVAALKDELKYVKLELADATITINLQQELRLTSFTQHNEAVTAQLEKHAAELQQLRNDHAAALLQLQREAKAAKQQITNFEAANTALEEEKKEMKEELSDLKAAIPTDGSQALQEKLKEANTTLEERSARISSLTEELETAREELQHTSIQLESSSTELGLLQARVSEVETSLSEKAAELSTSKEQVAQLQKELEETKSQSEHATAELGETKGTIARLEKELFELRNSKASELNDRNSEIDECRNELDEARGELEQMIDRTAALTMHKRVLNGKIAKLDQKLESAGTRLQELQEANDSQVTDLATKQANIQQINAELATLKEAKQVLEAEREEKLKAIEQLNLQNGNLVITAEAQTQKITALTEQVSSLTEEVSELTLQLQVEKLQPLLDDETKQASDARTEERLKTAEALQAPTEKLVTGIEESLQKLSPRGGLMPGYKGETLYPELVTADLLQLKPLRVVKPGEKDAEFKTPSAQSRTAPKRRAERSPVKDPRPWRAPGTLTQESKIRRSEQTASINRVAVEFATRGEGNPLPVEEKSATTSAPTERRLSTFEDTETQVRAQSSPMGNSGDDSIYNDSPSPSPNKSSTGAEKTRNLNTFQTPPAKTRADDHPVKRTRTAEQKTESAKRTKTPEKQAETERERLAQSVIQQELQKINQELEEAAAAKERKARIQQKRRATIAENKQKLPEALEAARKLRAARPRRGLTTKPKDPKQFTGR